MHHLKDGGKDCVLTFRSGSLLNVPTFQYSSVVNASLRRVGITNSQATGLVVIGEVVTLLPLASVIWRKWNISTVKEGLALFSLGFSYGYFIAASTYCSQHMKLGISFCDLVSRMMEIEFEPRVVREIH